jgi:methyl-accepting chemotaxis protein
VTKISDVTGVIGEMANAAEVQAANLRDVNRSVTEMDKMTQQNAAMVEEATACARSLSGEADGLAASISRFHLNSEPGRLTGSLSKPAFAPPGMRKRSSTVGNLAVKDNDPEGWDSF